MLDAFIIEEIKRRERERERHDQSRPSLEVPVHRDEDEEEADAARRSVPVKPPNRGVVHIEV